MPDPSGVFLGREMRLTPNDSADPLVLGVEQKDVSLLGEALDITTDDDDSWQRFGEEPPRQGITLSVSGKAKGGFLKRLAESNNVLVLEDYNLFCPQVGTWTGNWIVSGVQLGATKDQYTTFSATINSNGELTFDPDADGTS